MPPKEQFRADLLFLYAQTTGGFPSLGMLEMFNAYVDFVYGTPVVIN